MTETTTSRLNRLLPAWARRGDPRWVLGFLIAAVAVVCCCSSVGIGLLVARSGNDSDDSGKDRSRPAAESDNRRDSSRNDPTGTPQPTETKRDHHSDDKPATKQVPDVVGKNAAVAADELKQAGFSKVRFASGDAEHQVVLVPQNWEVTKQSAPAFSQLKPDAVLVLTCRKTA